MEPLGYKVNSMTRMPGDPTYYPFTIDRRTDIPIVANHPDNLQDQQLVYTLILRRAYQNPNPELVKVYNSLFNPAIETYISPTGNAVYGSFEIRPQATLGEWKEAWARQEKFPKDSQGMRGELLHLMQKLDYKCKIHVGGEGKYAAKRTFYGGFENVEFVILAAARRCGVVLVKRIT